MRCLPAFAAWMSIESSLLENLRLRLFVAGPAAGLELWMPFSMSGSGAEVWWR